MEGKNDRYDLAVIGAGPAGLAAACFAARAGLKVCLIEKNAQPGKKLLMAGSGQCNLTQSGEIRDFFSHYGKASRFISSSLLNWTNRQLRDFFTSLNVETEDRGDGKIFPVSRKSRDVQDALVNECRKAGVRIYYKNQVLGLSLKEGLFKIRKQDKESLVSRFVMISTGGLSYPSTGSTGDGYDLAQSLGHSIIPPFPVLSPVFLRENPFVSCSGISFPSQIQIFREGKKAAEYRGDLLLTHKGLSGPVILNNSRNLRQGDSLKIRISPREGRSDFESRLIAAAGTNGKMSLKRFVCEEGIPEKLVLLVFQICGIKTDLTLAQLNKPGRKSLLDHLFAFPVVIQSVGGFNIAMATGGGIDLKEVNPKTMESRICEGLFFTGEVLDVDGDTGGYNLQFAFSSARLAADALIRKGSS